MFLCSNQYLQLKVYSVTVSQPFISWPKDISISTEYIPLPSKTSTPKIKHQIDFGDALTAFYFLSFVLQDLMEKSWNEDLGENTSSRFAVSSY